MILPLKKVPGDNYLFGRGGVVDSNNNYIQISGIENRIQGKYDVLNVEKRDEKVVYCGYLVPHWGHFLIEAVACLWYLFDETLLEDKYDKYIFLLKRMRKEL